MRSLCCGLSLCFIVLTGCTDAADRPGSPVDTTATSATPNAVDTSATSTGTKRYEAPRDFPLRFTAMLPEEWRTQRVNRNVGKTIRFYQDTGPQPASLELHLYRPGTSKDGVTTRIRDKAKGMGATVQKQPSEYDWAFTSYSFKGQRLAGTIRVGQRDSLFFYVMTTHPPGADSTFIRQARSVLNSWQWDNP